METKRLFEIQIPVAPNGENIRLSSTGLVADDRLVRAEIRLNKFQWIFSKEYHEDFFDLILSFSDGYSVLPEIVGVWSDGITLYKEKMIPVRIFCTAERIKSLAEFAKEHYEQESIFVAEIGTARFY
jgi:hypothetical protein